MTSNRKVGKRSWKHGLFLYQEDKSDTLNTSFNTKYHRPQNCPNSVGLILRSTFHDEVFR